MNFVLEDVLTNAFGISQERINAASLDPNGLEDLIALVNTTFKSMFLKSTTLKLTFKEGWCCYQESFFLCKKKIN